MRIKVCPENEYVNDKCNQINFLAVILGGAIRLNHYKKSVSEENAEASHQNENSTRNRFPHIEIVFEVHDNDTANGALHVDPYCI